MSELIKQSKSEKFLVGLILILIILILYIFVILPNKCLFVKNYDPKEINFEKPENISVLNVSCGNVIIELYPDISPVAVKRFKMLINRIVSNSFIDCKNTFANFITKYKVQDN